VPECLFLIDWHSHLGRFCEVVRRRPADGLRGAVRGDPGDDGVGSGAAEVPGRLSAGGGSVQVIQNGFVLCAFPAVAAPPARTVAGGLKRGCAPLRGRLRAVQPGWPGRAAHPGPRAAGSGRRVARARAADPDHAHVHQPGRPGPGGGRVGDRRWHRLHDRPAAQRPPAGHPRLAQHLPAQRAGRAAHRLATTRLAAMRRSSGRCGQPRRSWKA